MEHSKVFSAIQAAYPKLTAAERSVADFFLQNRERGDFSSKAVAEGQEYPVSSQLRRTMSSRHIKLMKAKASS